jgi:hypothetical protein
VQWVPNGLSPRRERGRGAQVTTTHLRLTPRPRIGTRRYLFICCLFNDAASSSIYIPPNNKTLNN